MIDSQVAQHQKEGCDSFHVVCVCGSVVSSDFLDVPLYLRGAAVLHLIWSVLLLYSTPMGLIYVPNLSQAGCATCSGNEEISVVFIYCKVSLQICTWFCQMKPPSHFERW